VGTAALGCPAEQRSATPIAQNPGVLCSTRQPGAAVPTWAALPGGAWLRRTDEDICPYAPGGLPSEV